MYASFGRAVFNSKDSNEIGKCINELVAKLRERKVLDSEFDVDFDQITYTKTAASQKALVQYILRKCAIHEQQPTLGDSDDLTIEHLIPQSHIKSGIPESVVGQIGNLILVDPKTNELLSTNDFKQKKNILVERGYKLPNAFLAADALTPELVLENTRRVSALARDTIWRI